MQIGEAFVAVRPDTSKFGPQLQQEVTGAGQRAGTSLNQVLGAAAFGALLKGSLDAASNLEQAVGGTSAVFQENASVVDAWAQNSVESVGLSERAYREMASVIGAQLSGAGLSLDEATNSTRQLVSIGADLAATFGGTTQEAVSALGATLRGEYDPAERFGLALTAVRVQAKAVELGLADSTGAVSSSAKAQATLALIMEQTANAQGQFARESDTAAGAAQRARAEAENQAAAFGDQLLPAYSSVLGVASQLAGVFGALPGPIQTMAVGLAGVVALRGPVGGAFSFISDGASGMVARFREAGGGAKGLKAAITPSALGAVGAVAALTAITTALQAQSEQAAETRGRITELGDAYLDAGRAGVAESLLAQITEDAPDALAALDDMGVNLRDVVDALASGDAGAAQDFADQFGEVVQALVEAGEVGQAEDLAAIFSSVLPGIEQAAFAEEQLTGATEGTNASLDDQVSSLDAISDAADAALDALESLFGIEQTLDEATLALQASHDDLSASIRENGRTFNVNTAAGRSNLQAAREQATAIREHTIALAAQTGSARRATGAQDFLTAGLRRTLQWAGLSRGETNRLIDTYARVPRSVITDVTLNGADTAISQLQRISQEAQRAAAAVNQVGGSLAGGGAYGAERALGPKFGPPPGAPTLTATGPSGGPPITVIVQAGTVVGDPQELARQIAPAVGREIETIQRRA